MKNASDEKLFLSFIVPVYNIENYLRSCLDSLIMQDIEKEQYEIICINDGSTDGSLDILREYEKVHSNLRIIDKENAGVSAARNIGLKEARGEYIWFVDSDDFIQTNCLKKLLSFLKENKEQIVKFQYKKVEENEQCLKTECPEISIKYKNKILVGPYIWHMVVRRDFLFEQKISFREDLSMGEDALFQYYVWLKMDTENCVEINNILYLYRKRVSSVTRMTDVNTISKQTRAFMQIAKIYQDEELALTDKRQKYLTKQRQYLAILNALTYLPESSLSCDETLKKLKEERLYPFPFLWRHIFQCRGIKGKLREFFRNLFKYKVIYLIYYKIAKNNGIISKHKKSI